MLYRMNLRKFDQDKIESILRYSDERYFDHATRRRIAIGHHDRVLVMIPYEQSGETITPVTIHATTRGQINFRIKTGRFKNE
ncbi:hypothetical protein JW979_13110 [bacterium]|nr:hypothetical protein [candidate division CSSED10-310 bacterium]